MVTLLDPPAIEVIQFILRNKRSILLSGREDSAQGFFHRLKEVGIEPAKLIPFIDHIYDRKNRFMELTGDIIVHHERNPYKYPHWDEVGYPLAIKYDHPSLKVRGPFTDKAAWTETEITTDVSIDIGNVKLYMKDDMWTILFPNREFVMVPKGQMSRLKDILSQEGLIDTITKEESTTRHKPG